MAKRRVVIGPAAPKTARPAGRSSSKRTAVPAYTPIPKKPNREVSSHQIASEAEKREFFRGYPTSEYTEPEVQNLKESERFSWESTENNPANLPADFIPLTYAPTKTSWPSNGHDHRRTVAAGYDRSKGILRVKFFTNGAVYDYGVEAPVPPYVAYSFRNNYSPGRFINSTLESYGYSRIS